MHSKKILQVMLILLGATLVIFGFQLIQENRLQESGFGPSSPLISFYHIVRIIQGLFIIVLGFTLDYFLKNSSKMLASVIAAIGVMEVLTGHFLGIKILIIFATIYLFYTIKKLPNDSPKILLILTVVAGVIETLFAIYTTGILIAPFIILLTIYLVRNFLKTTPSPNIISTPSTQPNESPANKKKLILKVLLPSLLATIIFLVVSSFILISGLMLISGAEDWEALGVAFIGLIISFAASIIFCFRIYKYFWKNNFSQVVENQTTNQAPLSETPLTHQFSYKLAWIVVGLIVLLLFILLNIGNWYDKLLTIQLGNF